MKYRFGAAAALVAVKGAYAQTTTAAPAYDGPVSYTTVTYDTCSTAAMETMITVTNGMTVTYCPTCTDGGGAVSTAASPSVGYVTTYTTTYLSLCPTGMVPATHTVTESCPEATPTWTPGPSHVPQGYTVTVKDCTVCHSDLSKPSTIPVTITEPCDCDAHEGTIMPPKPTSADATPTSNGPAPSGQPVQQISDGQIQNPAPSGTPVQQISDGKIQNPGPSNAPAASCPGGDNCPAAGTTPAGTASANTAPAGTAPAGTAPAGTAPAGTAPGTAPAGTGRPVESAPDGNSGSDSPPAAYQGGASRSIISVATAIVVMVGAFAVLL